MWSVENVSVALLHVYMSTVRPEFFRLLIDELFVDPLECRSNLRSRIVLGTLGRNQMMIDTLTIKRDTYNYAVQ